MNSEHYQDPTADKAISAISRSERKRQEKRKNRRYRIRRMLLKRALEQIATICGFKVHITFIESKVKL